ncbi:MAG: GNAT family N-acetyltransferase [Calditrichia bacterium]
MIELQPFTQEDVPRLAEWVDNEELCRQWTGNAFSWPLQEVELLDHLQLQIQSGAGRLFRAWHIAKRQVVGHIELNQINKSRGTASICRALIGSRGDRQLGLGTRMVEQVCDVAFGEIGVDHLFLKVLIFNLTAVGCYKNVGFCLERTLDQDTQIGDRFWSTYLMRLDREVWQAQK